MLSTMFGVLADTATTDPTITETEPARPLGDWARGVFGDGRVADVVSFIIEPALQILLIVVIIAVVKWLANRLIQRIVHRMKHQDERRGVTPSSRRATRADALGTLLRSIANVVIMTIGVFMALGVFGINLAPLIAGAGIIGLAVGFGAQDLVSDFLSGVFMLAEDQFGVGDFIDVGEASGTVEGISLRTTRLRDVNGALWHVPNGEVRRVGNFSQEWARMVLDVSVSYDTDTDRASEIILAVANEVAADEAHAGKFLEPPEVWGVQAMGADAVDIRLVAKTTPGTQWGVARELRRRVKYALDEAHVEIPFPQRTVWLRTDEQGTGTPLIDVAGGADGDGRAR